MKYKTADDRLIRVGDAYEYWKNKADTVTKFNQAKMLRNMLDEVPSAQPKIIFCKDCKYFTNEFGWNGEEYTVCSEEGHNRPLVNADDFCSQAERKGNNL